MRTRHTALTTALVALPLALAACGGGAAGSGSGDDVSGKPGGGLGDSDGTASPDVVAVASDAEFTSYNPVSTTGSGSWNDLVLAGVLSSFWRYDAAGRALPNDELGTYVKTSDDPLTVTYQINRDAVWSDGEPIDCDDVLLDWAANSGHFSAETPDPAGTGSSGSRSPSPGPSGTGPSGTGSPGTGSGEPGPGGEPGLGGEPAPDGQPGPADDPVQPEPLFEARRTDAYDLVQKPTCEPGAKEVTFVYTEPYADWRLTTDPLLPAHVVAEQGGLSPEDLVAAIQADDATALAPAAQFWNTGWDMARGQLLDPALIPSSGPYVIDDWQAGQSLTLRPNEHYWGAPAKTDTVVVRFIPAERQVEALTSGEVDVIAPPLTDDVRRSLGELGGDVELAYGDVSTWEHLDFNQNPGALFADPALREAFARCLPRQKIVDDLVAPIHEGAVPMDLHGVFPGDELYDDVREAAFDPGYAEPDVDAARALVDQADAADAEVRIVRPESNPLRADVVAAIADSCERAGFDVVDTPVPDLTSVLADPSQYEAALFGWSGSGGITSAPSLYRTGSAANPYGFSSPELDRALDALSATVDEEQQAAALTQVETLLWAELPSVPLFAHPGVTAYSSDLRGVAHSRGPAPVTLDLSRWSRGP